MFLIRFKSTRFTSERVFSQESALCRSGDFVLERFLSDGHSRVTQFVT